VYALGRLPVSRRRLLMLRHLDHCWIPEVTAEQRTRMLAALRQLCGKEPAPGLREMAAPCALLSAQDCTACGVCVRACPTKALSIERSDTAPGAFALKSLLSRCDDCGRCVALCPPAVLVRLGQVDYARLLDESAHTVTSNRARLCAHCGGSFAASSSARWCPPCSFRLENPFGSRRPSATAGKSDEAPGTVVTTPRADLDLIGRRLG
jgi:ferredoxin